MAPGEAPDCLTVNENGVFTEIKKLGNNSRSVRSKIVINASFETVWKILTDYENFADVVPGLVVCKVLDKNDNFARVYQVSQQKLPLGMKIKSKMVLDCFEKEIEISTSGKKRDIEFKMVEGDFPSFEGKWIIEQITKPESEENDSLAGKKFETTLSYIVDVKPMAWLPVHLVEGKFSKEIHINLLSIREKAHKMINGTAGE